MNPIAYIIARLVLIGLLLLGMHLIAKPSKSSSLSRAVPIKAEDRLVTMKDNKYSPNFVTVIVGQRITFHNDDTVSHTVTSGVYGKPPMGKDFNSQWISPNKTWSWVPTKPGRYPYFCIPHAPMGMKGIIMVIE